MGCKDQFGIIGYEANKAFYLNYVGCKVPPSSSLPEISKSFTLTMWDVKYEKSGIIIDLYEFYLNYVGCKGLLTRLFVCVILVLP